MSIRTITHDILGHYEMFHREIETRPARRKSTFVRQKPVDKMNGKEEKSDVLISSSWQVGMNDSYLTHSR